MAISLQDFWNYRDELSVLDGLVLKGTHIVVPESCRDEILDQLHEGHFGIDRTKLSVQEIPVYWPSINKDIECLVKTCDLCQEHSHGEILKILQFQEIFPFKHGQQYKQTYLHAGWSVISACSRCNFTVPSGQDH